MSTPIVDGTPEKRTSKLVCWLALAAVTGGGGVVLLVALSPTGESTPTYESNPLTMGRTYDLEGAPHTLVDAKLEDKNGYN